MLLLIVQLLEPQAYMFVWTYSPVGSKELQTLNLGTLKIYLFVLSTGCLFGRLMQQQSPNSPDMTAFYYT